MASIIESNLRYYSSTVGLDQTGYPLLLIWITKPWVPMTLSTGSPVVLPFTTFHPDHCILGTPHTTCRFEDALTQSSCRHNLPQILALAHFSCFRQINFKKWLFTCSLNYASLLQVKSVLFISPVSCFNVLADHCSQIQMIMEFKVWELAVALLCCSVGRTDTKLVFQGIPIQQMWKWNCINMKMWKWK